jgi:hypothetical protein
MADVVVEPDAFFGVVCLPAACHRLLQEGAMGKCCLLVDRLNLLSHVAHTVPSPPDHGMFVDSASPRVEARVLEYSDGFLLLNHQVNEHKGLASSNSYKPRLRLRFPKSCKDLRKERLYFLRKAHVSFLEVTISREIRGHNISVSGDEHEIEEILRALNKASEAIKHASNEELAAQHP